MSKSVPCPTLRRPSYVCTVWHVGTKNTTSYTVGKKYHCIFEIDCSWKNMDILLHLSPFLGIFLSELRKSRSDAVYSNRIFS